RAGRSFPGLLVSPAPIFGAAASSQHMLVPGGVGFASPLLGGWTSVAFWTEYDLPKLTRTTFIGILIAVSGNILISLALNLQKLAHRRIETGFQVKRQETASVNGARRRHSDAPILDGYDEDATQTATPLDLCPSDTRPTEADPFISLSHAPNYRSVAHGTSGGVANKDCPRLASASQPIPAWFRRQKSGRSTSDAPLDAVIAVDMVSEETALRGQSSKSHRQSMVEDGNETAYLKSKLWFVFTTGSFGSTVI
ncbi:hypothetical protein C0993_002103, partial [Termitomyces sp. T159_Od127]